MFLGFEAKSNLPILRFLSGHINFNPTTKEAKLLLNLFYLMMKNIFSENK